MLLHEQPTVNISVAANVRVFIVVVSALKCFTLNLTETVIFGGTLCELF